jgi:hypothetical protein
MKIKPKKNYLVQFGTLVVTSRRAAHITQEALAEKAGLHPNFRTPMVVRIKWPRRIEG